MLMQDFVDLKRLGNYEHCQGMAVWKLGSERPEGEDRPGAAHTGLMMLEARSLGIENAQ